MSDSAIAQNQQQQTICRSRQQHQRQTRRRRIVLLAGLSGSGKTSMGERMKRVAGAGGGSTTADDPAASGSGDSWIHFDGDTWTSGGDPVDDSGRVVNVAPKETRDDITKAFKRAQEEGYNKLFQKEPPSYEAFEEFYDLMCRDVAKVFLDEKNDGRNIILTHSVYRSSTRAFIKRRLEELLCDSGGCPEGSGNDDGTGGAAVSVQIVVIRCYDSSLVDRRTDRAKNQATEAKMSSLEEYLAMAMKNGFNIREPTEAAFRDHVALWNNGFEDAAGDGEQMLDVTDGKDLDAMFEALRDIVCR